MGVHALIWAVRIFAWALIFFFGIRIGLLSKYRLVFVMILASMIGELLTSWLSFSIGVSNMTYAWALVVIMLVTESLTAAVLLQICSLPKRITFRGDWPLFLIPTILAGFTLLQNPEIWFFARLCSAVQLAVTCLGVATIVRTSRREHFQLGWNFKMVLVAITIPSVFGTLAFYSHLTGMLTREAGKFWLSGAGIAGWIILAAGMIEYSPPVLISDLEEGRTENRPAEEVVSTRNLG